jgi:hypothetical protein
MDVNPTSQLDIRNHAHHLPDDAAAGTRLGDGRGVHHRHDVNLAGRFADELMLMRDGQVIASGPPQEVLARRSAGTDLRGQDRTDFSGPRPGAHRARAMTCRGRMAATKDGLSAFGLRRIIG